MMKKLKLLVLALVLLLILVMVFFSYIYKGNRSALQPTSTLSQEELIQRGAYLARAGDCIACHVAKDGQPFAGGLGIASPVGMIYTSTSHPTREPASATIHCRILITRCVTVYAKMATACIRPCLSLHLPKPAMKMCRRCTPISCMVYSRFQQPTEAQILSGLYPCAGLWRRGAWCLHRKPSLSRLRQGKMP